MRGLLKARCVLIAGLLPITAVIAVAAAVRGFEVRALYQQHHQQLQNTTAGNAARLDAALASYVSALNQVAENLAAPRSADARATRNAVRQTARNTPGFDNIFQIASNGRLLARVGDSQKPLLIPPLELQARLGDTALYVSSPMQHAGDLDPYIVLAVPLRAQARTLPGFVGAQVNLANDPAFQSLVDREAQPYAIHCLRFPDSTGVLLQAGPNGSVNTAASSIACHDANQATWIDRIFPTNPVVARAAITTTGWELQSSTPAYTAFAPFRRAQIGLGITALLGIAAAMGVAWWITRLLMRPLARLRQAVEGEANDAGTGDTLQHANHSFPEVGALAASFRHTLVDLRRRVRTVSYARDIATVQAERARLTADLFPDLAGLIGKNGRFMHVNKPHEVQFNKPASDIYGMTVEDLWGSATFAELKPFLDKAFAGSTVTFTLRHGTPRAGRWIETTYQPVMSTSPGEINAVHFRVRDLTAERQNALRFQREVETDVLTGLLNRRGLNHRLEHALAKSSGDGGTITLMYVDLDRFKAVNDTYGHGMGDDLLKTFSQRLAHGVRNTDALARLGGDEFVVLIDGNEPEYIERVASAILACARLSFNFGENWIEIGASIGISSGTGGEKSVRQLCEEADAALYQAKRAGKDCFRHYRAPAAA